MSGSFANIENDLSSLHELDEGEFLLSDPQLLESMVFSKDIHHKEVTLVTAGQEINTHLLSKLQEMGVQTVFAHHELPKNVKKAVKKVDSIFDSTREAIFKEGVRTTFEAIEVLRKGERINIDAIKKELPHTIEEMVRSYSRFAADGVRQLKEHHAEGALHSVEVSLRCIELAKELNWPRERVIQAALCGMLHDVGKAGVSADILNYTGTLNDEQWQEIQAHALIGYLILSDNENMNDVAAFVAGAHHERFSGTGRRYGILSHGQDLGREIQREYDDQAREMAHLVAICDVHSALGENKPYRPRKLPAEVLTIMNLEAKHGRFKPLFYRAWHTQYTRKHAPVLQKGHCFTLSSVKRRELAANFANRVVLPMTEPRLTFAELTKLGLIPKLLAAGIKMKHVKQNSGVTLHKMEQNGIKDLAKLFHQKGFDPEKPVNYNLVVTEALGDTKARFLIMKEGDTLVGIRKAVRDNTLDPVQQYLLEHRNVELDFTSEFSCPI